MKTIIESLNFEPTESLNKFIREKTEFLTTIDEDILFAEFNLSRTGSEYICTLILVLVNCKNIIVTAQDENVLTSVFNAVSHAEIQLRRKKIKDSISNPFERIELRSYMKDDEDPLFDFSVN